MDTDDAGSLQLYTAIVCVMGLILMAVTFFFDFKYAEGGNKGQEAHKAKDAL